jgi:hypothetical protein
MAFPASAAETPTTGCTMRLVADQPHVAEVTCANALTSGPPFDEFVMSVDGLDVWLTIRHKPGEIGRAHV